MTATPITQDAKAMRQASRRGDAEPLAARIRAWLLAGFAAVCVARPLVPSEGVSWLGDGHAFTMALLLLASGCLILAWQRGNFTRRAHALDWAVAALVGFCVLSALLGVAKFMFGISGDFEMSLRHPAPRVAVNMTWEWIGFGLIYFLARQLPESKLQSRVLVAIMVALAVAMSVLGLYQVAVTLPAERAAYAADPDAALSAMGQWFPAGSPERTRFEARLASTEPLATFALTNSLAGLLVAWLVVLLGIAWELIRKRHENPLDGMTLVRFGGVFVALGLMLICLALTKSRSAFVALACGLFLLPLILLPISRAKWKWIAASAAGCALLASGLLVAGVGEGLVNAAARSFQFRVEYWQATLDMIANFPLLGVGPGEYQDYYTQFKLPQASEEVRDPHNFILEVWATGGTLALLALAAVLAGFGWAWYEARQRRQPKMPAAPAIEMHAAWLPMLGALVGLPLAYAAGLPFGFQLSVDQGMIAAVTGSIVVFSLWNWLRSGDLSGEITALGVLVLMIHWLASGGFTFPGVAGSFWLLLGLTANEAGISESAVNPAGWRRWVTRPRWMAGISIALALAGLVACYWTAFLPVLAARAILARAANEQIGAEARFGMMLQASAADRLSAEPFMAIAELSADQIRNEPTNPVWAQRLVRATSGVLVTHGQSSARVRHLGHLFRDVYAISGNSSAADRSVDMSRAAAQYYPNSAVLQAEYALALHVVANKKAARRAAERALKLDELTPHADKKLPDDLRSRMRELVEEDST